MNETKPNHSQPEVIIGTPVSRHSSFALDKFMASLHRIQAADPDCYLIMATDDSTFTDELKEMLSSCQLRGEVIEYRTLKPEKALSRLWGITCGREAIRHYVVTQSQAEYLLFLDADITVNPEVTSILKTRIRGYDVVHSAYILRGYGIAATGLGCSMITRDTLKNTAFRCLEFNNGQVIDEGNLFEMDLFRNGRKVKRGYFVKISHYSDSDTARFCEPKPLGVFKTMVNLLFVRYLLTRTSIFVKYDIPGKLQKIIGESKLSR